MKLTVTNSRARTNRRFSLLGAIGLLAITVIQLPNLADLLEQLRSQRARHAEMLAGLAEPQRTAELEKQLASVDLELKAFEQRMVGFERMPTIQSLLMELARDSGCQLRKAVIQARATETWEPIKPVRTDAELQEELADPAAVDLNDASKAYTLTTEQLSLSLTGSLNQTLDFLDRMRQQPWLMKVAQINFSRDGEEAGQLIVEANLAFYQLVHQEKAGIESVQWRDGSRARSIQ